MNLKIESEPDTEPFPVEYKNVKGFICMALTEKNGEYILESYHGYGEIEEHEQDNEKLDALIRQFSLYWQDARMWMKEIK